MIFLTLALTNTLICHKIVEKHVKKSQPVPSSSYSLRAQRVNAAQEIPPVCGLPYLAIYT